MSVTSEEYPRSNGDPCSTSIWSDVAIWDVYAKTDPVSAYQANTEVVMVVLPTSVIGWKTKGGMASPVSPL